MIKVGNSRHEGMVSGTVARAPLVPAAIWFPNVFWFPGGPYGFPANLKFIKFKMTLGQKVWVVSLRLISKQRRHLPVVHLGPKAIGSRDLTSCYLFLIIILILYQKLETVNHFLTRF